jgi:hypothetical protein
MSRPNKREVVASATGIGTRCKLLFQALMKLSVAINDHNQQQYNTILIRRMQEPGSTESSLLLRSSLYEPLASIGTRNRDDGAAPQQMQRVPKSLQESSLVEFYRTLSVRYHRQPALATSLNTGHRPLTVSEINDKIRQRAITLAHTNYNDNNKSRRTRKRKRKSTTSSCPQSVRVSSLPIEDSLSTVFLTSLQSSWLDYFHLQLRNWLSTCYPRQKGAKVSFQQVEYATASCLRANCIEWVGAPIQVTYDDTSSETTVSKKSYSSKKALRRNACRGILVSQSATTLRVASTASTEPGDGTTLNIATKPKIPEESLVTVTTIPREGSRLEITLLLPWDEAQQRVFEAAPRNETNQITSGGTAHSKCSLAVVIGSF